MDFVAAHGELIHWTVMVKRKDLTFLMNFTVRCTTSPWSPDQAGNSRCFCKQDPEINDVIVIIGKTWGCNSNYETTLRFIVNSVSVYGKLNNFFENGKDNWCFCNFPSKKRLRLMNAYL